MDEYAAINGSGWGKLESNEVDLFLVCRRHWTALMQVKDRCILLAYVLLVLPTSAGQQTAINNRREETSVRTVDVLVGTVSLRRRLKSTLRIATGIWC